MRTSVVDVRMMRARHAIREPLRCCLGAAKMLLTSCIGCCLGAAWVLLGRRLAAGWVLLGCCVGAACKLL
eukprot:10589635-Lingulodinium_polyedra.AAC.1